MVEDTTSAEVNEDGRLAPAPSEPHTPTPHCGGVRPCNCPNGPNNERPGDPGAAMTLLSFGKLTPDLWGEPLMLRKPGGFQIPCDFAGDWARHVAILDGRSGPLQIVEMGLNGMGWRELEEVLDEYTIGMASLGRTEAERFRTLEFVDAVEVSDPDYGRIDLGLMGNPHNITTDSRR